MLYAMLAATVARDPAHIFMEMGEDTLDYGGFLAAVDAFAETLAGLDIGSGDPAIVLLPNGPEFAIACFAIARNGGIIVPLNTAFQAKELEYYLTDSGAGVMITTPAMAEQHGEQIRAVSPKCTLVTDVPVHVDPKADCPQREPYSGTGLYQYSSGSTGTPKRVVRTQQQLLCEADNYHITANTGPDDRILAVVPMFHAHGFGNCLIAAARSGATLVVLPAFKRKAALTTLAEKEITIFPGVPFMFSILADSPSIAGMPLPKLRLAFSAGAPLGKETFDNFLNKFGVPVRQLYGSTETGSITINLDSTDGERWASIGKPMANVTVNLIDDNGNPAAPGEEGEVVVESGAMTAGYANLEETNRETFRDGQFWSGDLGRLDEDGNIYITGRKRLFINAGGNKVDPGQVEEVINSHAAVHECVVVGVKGQYGQEIVKAAVVLNEGAECTKEAIKDWCEGKLAEFKIPRIIEFRAEIPRSPLGKILRKYLQEEVA